jgi:N-acetylmuramoyl-L-alanine amidase
MPTALKSRLNAVFTDVKKTRVMNERADWAGGFGAKISEVRSIIAHTTAGWPTQDKADEFVKRYVGPDGLDPPDTPKVGRGYGTQYYLAGNGAAFQLIDMPLLTWHANHINVWAIGVEAGNLANGDAAAGPKALTPVHPPYPPKPPANTPNPPPPPYDNRWRPFNIVDVPGSPRATEHADDLLGMKLWYRPVNNEVLVSWWTTRTYAGPKGVALGDERFNLFTEQQYRSWALLARFLCEELKVPRNFPLLPYAKRGNTVSDSEKLRRIALADERFSMLVRGLATVAMKNPPVPHSQESDFEQANAATFAARYAKSIIDVPKRQNRCWTKLFDVYRGIHGHAFSGANSKQDHDCPGPVFDWYRFAREVWDWWWYPFDLTEDLGQTPSAVRPYRRAGLDTPLREYYFEAPDFDAKEEAYRSRTEGMPGGNGIFGATSSPSTFRLDSAGVPIYAPANGELVAARFPDTGDGVSMAFLLVRHEIFHLPDTLGDTLAGFPPLGGPSPRPGSIDYDQEPSYVYSLVMHLARPEGFSFTEVTDSNPEWLNRVLIRKKECDLVLELHRERQDGVVSPDEVVIPAAFWNARPVGTPQRPTALEAWRADAAGLGVFLDRLRAGDVAVGATGRDAQASIRVLLGDFLGHGGVIRREGATVRHGIGLETFSSSSTPPSFVSIWRPGFVPPAFQRVNSTSGWVLPTGTPSHPSPAVSYQSEWSKTPTAEERQRLQGIGVNPDLVNWWGDASVVTQLHPTLPQDGRLSTDGWAFHYRPLDFMRWLNYITWASEWPKYKVTDADGNAVPQPPRPRSRNV